MEATKKLAFLIGDKNLSDELKRIAEKVLHDQRITFDEGVHLYQHAELGYLGTLANYIREKKHGELTYFNRNFHIEPTNVCVYSCNFCSYSRLIKDRTDGWEMDVAAMLDIVKTYDQEPVPAVHITGGVVPKQNLEFYADFFKRCKAHRPDLHIKGLTPVEYYYIFKKAKLSHYEGLKYLQSCGLDSMPGGGAEIFHPEVREKIAHDKCNAEQWLDIHEQAHKLGMHTNATMLYGHIEEFWHRVDHMERLRNLQDKTDGFQAFIPLKFRNKDNQMDHVPETSVVEDLRNYAVARIYMDNFPHIKAYWAMISRNTAQLALSFGVDDIDGTLDDTTKIYSMAGAEEQTPAMSTRELVELIKQVGRHPIERDTLYRTVTDYKDVVFDESESKKKYYTLPVVN
ncbi:MAG: aminofutalosine synthase MqnE [Sphingobacterium sp.]